VRGAFRSYDMCTAYRMLDGATVDAPPVVCFNPYLETGLTDVQGTASNCMTCHRLADADPQYFSDNLKLDFPWSVTRAVR